MAAAPRAWFLDRDGTLIVHEPYLHDPERVQLLPTVRETLAAARARGELLFLFTNQSGVGRGKFTLADVGACNVRMAELLGLGALEEVFAEVCIAPEAPDQPSLYRKPSPRFILEQIAAHGLDPARCTMIGDNPSDWEAGLAAGVRAVAVASDLVAAAWETARERLAVPRRESLAGAFAVPR